MLRSRGTLVGALVLTAVLGSVATAQAPHDECTGALPLPTGLTPGTNEGSTTSPGSVPCSIAGSDVWYEHVAGADGLLTISTANDGGSGDFDTVLAAYTGGCGALALAACSDDVAGSLLSEVSFAVQAGQSVLLRVGGFLGEIGDFVLAVTLVDLPDLVNDECSGALPLVDGETSGSTLGAVTSAGAVGCGPMTNDIWFAYTAAADGLLTISTATNGGSADFDTLLTAYGGGCDALDELACNDDYFPSLQSLISLVVSEGQELLVRLGGYNGASGSFVLAVELLAGEPPANDTCDTALLVTTDLVGGNTLLASTGPVTGSCTITGNDVWFLYVAPAAGLLTASLLNNGGSADFDTTLAAFGGDCGNLQELACNDDVPGGSLQSELSIPVSTGQLYRIAVGGFLGETGQFTLSLQLQPVGGGSFFNPFTGHTYAFTPEAMTWQQARDYAETAGGHLATFGDIFEQLTVQLNLLSSGEHWIGLTDELAEGQFAWVTGEPVSLLNWGVGQPDDDCAGASEDYAAMVMSTGLWFDTTATGCADGLLTGLIEVDGPADFATVEQVGAGCPADKSPLLFAGAPVLGATLQLTVLDPVPEATGVLYGSAIPAGPVSFGGCEIFLDPATRFIVASFTTNALGIATLAAPVPADPALAGLGVALAAVLQRDDGHSPAVTNGLHLVLGY